MSEVERIQELYIDAGIIGPDESISQDDHETGLRIWKRYLAMAEIQAIQYIRELHGKDRGHIHE